MGTMKKKGKAGCATKYLTRTKAIAMLQITIAQFRRLCILKAVYPRVPAKKFKGETIYYLKKDIQHLMYEPVLDKMREQAAHIKKIVKAESRKDKKRLTTLAALTPKINVDHLLKERFPTFLDAVRELDDALCHIAIFAHLKANLEDTDLPTNNWLECQRVINEFHSYIVLSGALRKAFLSLKGVYLQAEVFGETVTWLLPYKFHMEYPKKVDKQVMASFLHFYLTQLHFVNYRLFTTLGLVYPPQLIKAHENAGLALSAVRMQSLKEKSRVAAIEVARMTSAKAARKAEMKKLAAEKKKKKRNGSSVENNQATLSAVIDNLDKNEGNTIDEEAAITDINADVQGDENDAEPEAPRLFSGLKFFLSREVPIEILEVMLRAFGAEVGWAGVGSEFEETDESITHQVVDRDTQRHLFLGREYVQPQWVVDSLNNSFLLPVDVYGPGKDLPAHLSPFVNDKNVGYVPDQRKWIEAVKQGKQYPAAGKKKETGDEDVENDAADEESESDDEPYQKPEYNPVGEGADGDDEVAIAMQEKFEREVESELAGKSSEEAAALAKKLEKKRKQRESAFPQKKKKTEEEEAKDFAVMMMPNKQRRQFLKEKKVKKTAKSKIDHLKKRKKSIDQA